MAYSDAQHENNCAYFTARFRPDLLELNKKREDM